MAVSVDQLTAITHRYIMPKMFDAIFDSNPTLKRILSSGQYISIPGGTSVDIPLNYAQASATGWYSGADSLNTNDQENISVARYGWCSLYAGMAITEEDELKNGGSAGVLKLLASKAQIAEKTIKDQLGTGLYSDGTTAKSIAGLRDIVAVDQTVGNIAQSTNSWWQGQVDSTTTTTTIAAVNTQYENATIDNEKPTVLLSTRSIYTKYYNLLQPMQRFTDSETAKGGFVNLMFNGVPWISDSHCPSNHLFGLNEKHLWLAYHPERNFKAEDWQKPINQQVKVSRILWMGAFGSSNNRLHFKFSGLTA
jgi:hypothetical protein